MNENSIAIPGNTKTMPNVAEAERAVIGSILLDKEAILKIADFIDGRDFYHDHHRFVYEAALDLFQSSEPVDLVTVSTKLQSQDKLETVGGPEYLAELQNEVPVASHIFKYAQLVKHSATLRKLIKAGNEITALGYDMEKPLADLLESAERQVFAVSQAFIKNRFVPVKEIIKSSYEKICEIHDDPEAANANRIQTTYTSLDEKLNGGFNRSDLIVIAARPSIGKTALALSIAQNVSIEKEKKVGIISLEMSKEQLVERMFCSLLEVDSWKLHKGKLGEQDFERMGPVMDRLSSAHIYIDDSMGSSIVELRSKARRLQMEYGLDLLVIDYLQLMNGMANTFQGNRVQEISEISRGLKELARELNVPVIAISQLSRSVESRQDKRPVLSDLRDSGAIEQDADVVMMLYRDDYYNEDSDIKNELEVNVIKHRNGNIGKVFLNFDRSRMTFSNMDKNHQEGF